MSNVVSLKSKTSQPVAPRGTIDVGAATNGMILVDALIPVALAAEWLKFAETSGIPIRNMID